MRARPMDEPCEPNNLRAAMDPAPNRRVQNMSEINVQPI